MYALTVSADGECYLCVPPDPGIEAAALGASESALPGTAPAEALHTFTLDSCASRCFFHDSTKVTPLPAPVAVRLADPSGGPVLARSSTVLPCPAVLSGSLSGLHLPSFSTNLVSTAALQDAMVTTTTPEGQRVSICACTRTGRHLATFTYWLGSSLYTLTTEPPQVAASGQVSASGQVAAPCLCRLLSHQTLLWHHRLGHPSLPRLRGLHSHLLVSGLQRAAPHSSLFPPKTAPLQTLLLYMWGPARVRGQGRERYFLLVVDDYSRYTTRFREDLPVLLLHSDRGGEFASDLLWEFCRGEGIRQWFTLPASAQQNGVAECRIGLVMEVARTSMIHAAAPHFMWPFATSSPPAPFPVSSLSFPLTRLAGNFTTLPCALSCPLMTSRLTSARTGGTGAAGAGGATGAGARDPRVGGAGAGGTGGAGAAGPRGARSGGPGAAGTRGAGGAGADGPGGAAGAGARDPGDGGAGAGGTGGAGAAHPGGARTGGTGATGAGGAAGAGAVDPGARGAGAIDPGATCARAGDPGAGGAGPGGARGVGTGTGGTVRPRPFFIPLFRQVLRLLSSTGLTPPLLCPPPNQSQPRLHPDSPLPAPSPYTEQTDSLSERREPKSCPALPVCAVYTGRRVPRPRPPPVSGTHGVALRPSSVPLRVPLPSPPASSLLDVPDLESNLVRAASPTDKRLLAIVVTDPSFESTAASALVTKHMGPYSSQWQTAMDAEMASLKSTCTYVDAVPPLGANIRVPLPSPPASFLGDRPDPESDLARAASPTVPCLLATVVTDPSFESAAASSLVTELPGFACPPSDGGECALGTDVLEDRQEEVECLAAVVPRFASMLLAPEGDPDAPDIPTPRSYAEAITGPYSSQWQTPIEAEMASWKSTGTYVDEVPPPGANIVDGM
ncbi:unnamed protein product [Closterium sp. NIES-54]